MPSPAPQSNAHVAARTTHILHSIYLALGIEHELVVLDLRDALVLWAAHRHEMV